MRRRRSRSQSGYSLAEMLIVVAIIGILAGVSLPRLALARRQAQLSGATTRFTRAVMSARQVAIQTGTHSYFKTANDSLWVTIDPGTVVTKSFNLLTNYGVNITSPTSLTIIEYDPRGVSTAAAKQVFKFKHKDSGLMDSLCVSRLGNTIREACP
jgi:prepilin-type N-terminal cleavage/methylation domain-containing protein